MVDKLSLLIVTLNYIDTHIQIYIHKNKIVYVCTHVFVK